MYFAKRWCQKYTFVMYDLWIVETIFLYFPVIYRHAFIEDSFACLQTTVTDGWRDFSRNATLVKCKL